MVKQTAPSLARSLPWWALVALLALVWSQSSYFYFLVPRALATAGTATFGSSAGTGGNVYGNIFYDHDNTAFLIDPNATGTSASMAGTLSIGNGGFLRTNYGPLNLQYKSALDAWATALTIQDTTGNVGIGTTSPGQKLSVAGTVESTSGGFKFPDGTTQTSSGAIPTGMVGFFNLTACPSGWTALTAAAGYTIVGRAANESIGSTVGTALTSLENRTHTHTGPSHTHAQNGAEDGFNADFTINQMIWMYSENGGLTGTYTTGAGGGGYHFKSGVKASGTGATGTASTSNVIPYIQYLVCSKN